MTENNEHDKKSEESNETPNQENDWDNIHSRFDDDLFQNMQIEDLSYGEESVTGEEQEKIVTIKRIKRLLDGWPFQLDGSKLPEFFMSVSEQEVFTST